MVSSRFKISLLTIFAEAMSVASVTLLIRSIRESQNTSTYIGHHFNDEPVTIFYSAAPVNGTDIDVPAMPEGLRLVLAMFLFVVFVIGIGGNFTVIWIFTR